MRKGRQLAAILLGLFLLIGVLAGCSKPAAPEPAAPPAAPQANEPAPAPEPPPQPAEPIKIGAIFDATGGASSLGKPERDTVMMLVEEINAAGGINGRPIELVYQDSESDETKAVLAMKKLAGDPSIVGIVGGTTSGNSLAMLPEAEKNEIPFVSVAASIKIVEPVKKWVFKTPADDRLVVGRIVEWLNARGLKKVGWANVNNAFGDSGRAEFEKLAAANGLEIVANERFNHDDTDMTAQFTRIKAAGPEAVIIWSIPPSAAVAAKNAHQLTLGVPVLQSHGIANQAFIEQAAEAAEGIIFPAQKLAVWDSLADGDIIKPVAGDFVGRFDKKYGYFPTTFGAHAYDGFMMLVEAIKAVGTDRAQIRDHIEGLSNFTSAGGVFNMSATDHLGLTAKDIELVVIKDGKWVRYSD